jgi:hypothetical protein
MQGCDCDPDLVTKARKENEEKVKNIKPRSLSELVEKLKGKNENSCSSGVGNEK